MSKDTYSGGTNRPPAADASVSPPISDPATCGEDLVRDAERVLGIAGRFCGACHDSHVMRAYHRRLGHRSGVAADRPDLIANISQLLGARAARDEAPIDVVIAGAADTGILASAAHAAWAMQLLPRTRFTVLDLCRTPLELCSDYGDRHGLTLRTETVDLIAVESDFPADIIVVHSLFRQIPGETHVSTLRKFGTWLKPDGAILFSTSLRPFANRDKDTARRVEKLSDVRAAVESGRFAIGESQDAFVARVERLKGKRSVAGKLFSNADDVRRLFASAGMQPVTFLELSRRSHVAGGDVYPLERILSILRPI